MDQPYNQNLFYVPDSHTEGDMLEIAHAVFEQDICSNTYSKLFLYSDRVFIRSTGYTLNKHNFFWKIASYDIKENYSVAPCNNTPYLHLCTSLQNNIIINLNRRQCAYRASFIRIIKNIFSYVNNNDPSVHLYIKPQSYKGSFEDRLYIIYTEGHNHYKIVLAINPALKCYNFISAHPLTHTYSINQEMKDSTNPAYTRNTALLQNSISNYLINKK